MNLTIPCLGAIAASVLGGCTTMSTSYYVQKESTDLKITFPPPPPPPPPPTGENLKLAAVPAAAITLGFSFISSLAQEELKKENAKYTATWQASGDAPDVASDIRDDLALDYLHIEVTRKASPDGAAPGPGKVDFLFTTELAKPDDKLTAYRLVLADVKYPFAKAKIATSHFFGLGGSPKQNIDVQMDLKLQLLGVQTDDSGPKKTGKLALIDLLSTSIKLREIEPGKAVSYGKNGAKNPQWKSPWFILPQGFEIKQVLCTATVTETSAAPIAYTTDNLNAVMTAIKTSLGVK